MKVRNWHRRNTKAAAEMTGKLNVHGGSGHPVEPYVQLEVLCQGKGTLTITLTVPEAAEMKTRLDLMLQWHSPKVD